MTNPAMRLVFAMRRWVALVIMKVRVPAEWMVYADDRILEYLAEKGPASPTQITDDERIAVSRTHANLRLKKLTDAEMVRLIGNGIYEITEDGRDYLAGEFDAHDLEEPE